VDDLIALLERTTPAVSAPNVGGLKRRARVRRGRRWASVVVPLVVLAAGAIALSPATGRHVTTASAPPVGAWRRTSPPPLPLTSQVRTVTLSDGRLVVVAGSFDVDLPAQSFQSSVYDPHTDRWTVPEAAPILSNVAGADLLAANDQVVLVAHGDDGVVSVALLDGRSLRWRPISLPSQGGAVFDAWAWDGTTLVLARFGDNPYGPSPGSAGSPILERWNADTNTWRQGATPPTTPRFLAAVSRTPHRLALWGGYTLDPHALGSVPVPVPVDGTTPTTVGSDPARPQRALTDGAIYDIDHDSWSYLPPEPSLADMATRGAEGLLTSSTLTLVSSQVDGSPRITERYEDGSWHLLPSPSARGQMFPVQPETGTIAIATANESGPQSAQYIDGLASRWQTAPAYQLAQGPHGLLAVSATTDGPGNSALSVWQLEDNTWTAATPAPFPDRMEPGIGVVDNQLLVIGGQQGPNLERQRDAWLLDLTPTQ
jgi:hypothetical protein